MSRAAILLIAGLALTGCASAPRQPTVNLSQMEINDIAEGKLVKFTDVNVPKGGLRLNNAQSPNGVFVCASAHAFPTQNCYPEMGKLIGEYLKERGIPLAKDQASADVTLYFNSAFWFEGRSPDPNFTFALENWLVKGGGETVNAKQAQSLGSSAGNAAISASILKFGGLAAFGGFLGGGGGGYYDNRHWVRVSMVAVDTKTAVQVNNAPWSDKPGTLQRFEYAGRYIGPVKADKSTLVLFDQAVKSSLNWVIE